MADATVDWEFEEFKRVGPNVVCKIKKRQMGSLVLVYEDVPEEALVKWRVLDPSFTPRRTNPAEAPPPVAYFPATSDGWRNATDFARMRADMVPVEDVLEQ